MIHWFIAHDIIKFPAKLKLNQYIRDMSVRTETNMFISAIIADKIVDTQVHKYEQLIADKKINVEGERDKMIKETYNTITYKQTNKNMTTEEKTTLLTKIMDLLQIYGGGAATKNKSQIKGISAEIDEALSDNCCVQAPPLNQEIYGLYTKFKSDVQIIFDNVKISDADFKYIMEKVFNGNELINIFLQRAILNRKRDYAGYIVSALLSDHLLGSYVYGSAYLIKRNIKQTYSAIKQVNEDLSEGLKWFLNYIDTYSATEYIAAAENDDLAEILYNMPSSLINKLLFEHIFNIQYMRGLSAADIANIRKTNHILTQILVKPVPLVRLSQLIKMNVNYMIGFVDLYEDKIYYWPLNGGRTAYDAYQIDKECTKLSEELDNNKLPITYKLNAPNMNTTHNPATPPAIPATSPKPKKKCAERECKYGDVDIILPVVTSVDDIPLCMYYYETPNGDTNIWVRVTDKIVIEIPEMKSSKMININGRFVETNTANTKICDKPNCKLNVGYHCGPEYAHENDSIRKTFNPNKVPIKASTLSQAETLGADLWAVSSREMKKFTAYTITDFITVIIWLQNITRNRTDSKVIRYVDVNNSDFV